MAVRHEPWTPGAAAWIALTTDDLGAATGFYGSLFGWEFERGTTPDGRTYLFARLGGRLIAGLIQPATPGARAFWSVYFATDDQEASIAAAEAGGADVLPVPWSADSSGAVATAVDPGGAPFGLWAVDATRVGIELVDEPGTLTWVQLFTPDAAAARSFYGRVFGHTYTENTVGLVKLTFSAGSETVGGIAETGELPGLMDRPRWVPHFHVVDVDGATATALTHGGHVIWGPKTTQFGRVAHVRGPLGEHLALLGDVQPSADI
jgi:hypothetical protein